MHKAFAVQTAEQAEALARDLAELLNAENRAGASPLVVPSACLEAVITRR